MLGSGTAALRMSRTQTDLGERFAILVVSVRTGDRSLLHNLNLDPKRQVLLRPSLTPL